MARIITKELAKQIIKKLMATQVKRSGAHILYNVEHAGCVVASTSLRHGSGKDLGHDHIPRDLGLTPATTKRFAQCSVTREDLIREWVQQGRIRTQSPGSA